MKTMKMARTAVVALLSCAMLAGCSNSSASSDSTSIRVKEGVLEKETVSEAEKEKDIYVPDINYNYVEKSSGLSGQNYDLSQFSIAIKTNNGGFLSSDSSNTYNYDIADLSLDKLTSELGFQRTDELTDVSSTDEMYFTSFGFSGKADETSNAMYCYLELELNGKVTEEYNPADAAGYKVKGIKFTADGVNNSGYDLTMLGGKLYFGETKETVIAQLGEGYEVNNRIYYKTKDAVLAAEFGSSTLSSVYYICGE